MSIAPDESPRPRHPADAGACKRSLRCPRSRWRMSTVRFTNRPDRVALLRAVPQPSGEPVRTTRRRVTTSKAASPALRPPARARERPPQSMRHVTGREGRDPSGRGPLPAMGVAAHVRPGLRDQF